MVKVLIKWGKERYELEACSEDSPLQLKSQIFSLTGVKPDRQKVLVKGKVLTDSSWSGIELKDGIVMMMIGSKGELPKMPSIVFKEAVSTSVTELPYPKYLPLGLKNLGNMCYMNATIQCFGVIPELVEALENFSDPVGYVQHQGGPKALTVSVRDLFRTIRGCKGTSSRFVTPFVLIQTVHKSLHQFATQDEHGWMQQDANEFWTEMVRALQVELKVKGKNGEECNQSVVSRYMEGVFKVQMKNLETDAEPVTVTTENFLQISCFLSQEVKYIQSGIKGKLVEEVTKQSPALGRDAKYERRCLIDRLPSYLSIQMVRFFYKEKDKINAKILKDVKFPLSLDMYDMCTPELQKKLIPARDEFKVEEDKIHEALRLSKTKDDSETTDASATKQKVEKKISSSSFSDDPGSNNSGFYELRAVLTHKGRSSNSGHYVAWVRTEGDHWAMCDDEEVHEVSSDDILKLSGGGDWHCAYLLLYEVRGSTKQLATKS